jgi:hypothetical protein
VVLDPRQLVGRQLGIADDGAVGTDEGDSRRHEPSNGISLGIEFGRSRGGPMGQYLSREPHFVGEAALDALVEAAAHRPRHQCGGHRQGDYRAQE